MITQGVAASHNRADAYSTAWATFRSLHRWLLSDVYMLDVCNPRFSPAHPLACIVACTESTTECLRQKHPELCCCC